MFCSYPPFPDVIAFGKDRKKQGVACHHPKLIVLQRKESMRIVVTSANLNPKQVTSSVVDCMPFLADSIIQFQPLQIKIVI